MSIAISVAALVFSLAAFQYGRWRDRRDLLLKVHEHLVSADQHRGRRLLYTVKERQIQVEDISEEDYLLINNALAALNVLGIYYRRRYIRRKDVLELWAVPVLRAVLAGQAIMARRDTENGMPIWPHLRSLADDARRYTEQAGMTVQAPGFRPLSYTLVGRQDTEAEARRCRRCSIQLRSSTRRSSAMRPCRRARPLGRPNRRIL